MSSLIENLPSVLLQSILLFSSTQDYHLSLLRTCKIFFKTKVEISYPKNYYLTINIQLDSYGYIANNNKINSILSPSTNRSIPCIKLYSPSKLYLDEILIEKFAEHFYKVNKIFITNI